MKIYNRVLLWLVLIIAMCAVSVYFWGDIKGLYNRTFNVPELVTAISYADLEACDSIAATNKLKFDFYTSWKNKKGICGLKMPVYTIEGDLTILYCITDNGNITIIDDSTRDSYGCRNFWTAYPAKMVIGYYNSDGKFEVVNSIERLSEELLLKFPLGDGQK